MGLEPTKLIGPIFTAARPAVSAALSLWRRRGASPLDDFKHSVVERELDDALDLLAGSAGSLPDWFRKSVGALVSGRSEIFTEPDVREWLRRKDVQALVKMAALDLIADREIDELRERAAGLYANGLMDTAWYGSVAFDFALSYLLRTLDEKIPFAARATIDVVNRRAEELGAMVEALRERVEGLPIDVARSIVVDFGENGDGRSAGEIEEILRRKAREYQELQQELARIHSSDPRVEFLRDEALAAIKRADFNGAADLLLEARKLDREAGEEADRMRLERRASEAESVLGLARLSALRADYAAAYGLSLEAHELARDSSATVSARAVLAAANYLNTECHAIGSDGAIEANIRESEERLLPLAEKMDQFTDLMVRLEVADLYALLGYREGDNVKLARAARYFRRIATELPYAAPGKIKLRSRISLGDAHAEIGLNRGKLRQARIGLKIMQLALDDPEIDVSAAERANALIRLGTAQANAGLLDTDGTEFDDSVRSYEAAMVLVKELEEPLTQARAWWGFAIALAGQGKGRRSVTILAESERCCNEAMNVLTRDLYPVDWATNMQNRGNAKLERGKLENGVDTLWSALADFTAALEIRTPRRFRLGFAKSSGNRAIAGRLIADRTDDRGMAEQAKADIEAALAHVDRPGEEYWRNYYSDARLEIDATLARLRGPRGRQPH